jgi:hypothetical protein
MKGSGNEKPFISLQLTGTLFFILSALPKIKHHRESAGTTASD